MTYHVIYADPPWPYAAWRGKKKHKRTADSHYATLSLADLAALPVDKLARPDAVLAVWVTGPVMACGQHVEVMKGWGFIPKTVLFVWHKVTQAGAPAKGLGHYTRSSEEFVVLGTRGKGLPRKTQAMGQQIVAERRAHSAKPDRVRDQIKQLFGEEHRYVELFARQRAPGWDSLGEALDGRTMETVLEGLGSAAA